MDGPTAVRRVRFIALESETINFVRYSIQHLNLCGASAMKLSFMWSSKKTLQFKNEDVEGNCTIVFRGKIVFMSTSTIVFTK